MIRLVRTTVFLADRLHEAARERAAALGVRLSDIVNDAVRQAIAVPPARARAFRMITFGGSRRVHREPKDFSDD